MGFDSFHPGQRKAIKTLLDGKSALVVLPTGGGKSLIYQAVAEHVEGVVVVISPLIALMRDQAEAASKLDLEAAVINSHISKKESDVILGKVTEDAIKILYITPERLENKDFLTWLLAQKIGLIVVDEAHCVSEWGHDFRPSYGAIGNYLKQLDKPLTLALTATATDFVANDITKRLHMKSALIIREGIDRPNLYYEVIEVTHEEQKQEVLLDLLSAKADHPGKVRAKVHSAFKGSGIIYTSTTESSESIASFLTGKGIEAGYYHGQMDSSERDTVQDSFMKGKLKLVVATNAFGMGIDKQDVSFVVHYDVPPNIESYYQEAGRAGRNEKFAACVLMYRLEDMKKAGFSGSTGDKDRKEYEQGRHEMMQHYAERDHCRREFLLSYFGESYHGLCNMCDHDSGKSNHTAGNETANDTSPYNVGDVVMHKSWGKGTIQRIESGNATILFETVGHKSLSLELVKKNKLLQAISQ